MPERASLMAVWSPRLLAWCRRRRVIGSAVAIVLYAASGFLLLPALIGHYVPKMAAGQFGREATLGQVRVNPFLFTLEVRDFLLRDTPGTPLVGFGRLYVDFELESLLRRAWTFADIRLERPELDAVIGADGTLNLARLLRASGEGEAQEVAATPAPPRLLLRHVQISDGSVRFADHSGAQPATTSLDPINLRFNEISTLREKRGPYTVSAALPGGAMLSWRGEVSLHPLASTGSVTLEGFEPRVLWDFLRERLRLQAPRGVVEASADYAFSSSGGLTALRAESLRLKVSGLALSAPDAAAPLLELASIEMPGARFDLAARELVIPEFRVSGGRLAAVIDAQGALDWAGLVVEPPAPAAAPPAAPPAPAPPWRVELQSFALQDVAVTVTDASRPAATQLALGSTALGFAAQLSLGGAQPDVRIASGVLRVADVALTAQDEPAPLARLGRLQVEGVELDLAARRARVATVALERVDASLERLADGSIRQLALLVGSARPATAGAATQPPTDSGAPWQAVVDAVSLHGLNAAFTDRGTVPAVHYAVADGSLLLRDLHSDGSRPLAVEAALPLVQGGEIGVSGTAAIGGESAALQLRLRELAIAPLAPLVAKFTTLALGSGALSAELALGYRAPGDDAPSLTASGSLALDRLLLNEAGSGERFLEWRSLAANGIAFGLAPDRLAVRELRIVDPGAKIVIFEDGTMNLARLARGQAASSAAEAAPQPAFPVRIERVRIDGGTVDFADSSLVLPFAARIERFKGSATGISSAAGSRMSLTFGGRVGEFGDATVGGALEPFDPAHFSDIELRFRNVAMTPLSPYSATFAGRAIASGALDVTLQYKVDDSEMLGQNTVVLQDFTLGERVESPHALDLPIDLAIALLTDSRGRIDIAVPVSGKVDDPQFSYGAVIWNAVGNLVSGLVTAPFRALGAMFGGDEQSPDMVSFAPGSESIAPPEQELLRKIAQAMAGRPQLGLTVHAGFDPALDGAAMRDDIVRRALAERLGEPLQAGDEPGPVAVDDAGTQRALEALLQQRDGDQALSALASTFAASAGREPERVNPALALVGRASEDRAFYTMLFEHLVQTTPEPRERLLALAASRAAAITADLLEASGLEAARVRSVVGGTASGDGKRVSARLELGVL